MVSEEVRELNNLVVPDACSTNTGPEVRFVVKLEEEDCRARIEECGKVTNISSDQI